MKPIYIGPGYVYLTLPDFIYCFYVCEGIGIYVDYVFLIMYIWWCVGSSYQESAGEEYASRKYVLADLEFGSPEETGSSSFGYFDI